ncbi:hypothetical protein ACOMHN_032956 [Nucella lapillus]
MWKCINCHKRGHSSAYGGCPEVLVRKKALELQAQEYSLNFAAAIKVGVPDVSLIEKPDSRPYGYRRRVHVQVPRNEAKPAAEANTQPPAASWKEYTGPPIAREKTTTHTPSDVDKGQEDAKSPHTDNSANSENNQRMENEPGAGLLQQINVMMDTHTAAIENKNKIKLQCEVLNCKIEKISNDVLKLTAERQQQLDLARQVILKGIEVSKDPVTKCAFDILECFRQAARGNSEAVMNLAFKITPDHLRSSHLC